MNQSKGSWMTVAGLLVAGLLIVGLAVITSKPFQEKWAGTDAHDVVADEQPSESADDAADQTSDEAAEAGSSEAADAAPTEAAEDVTAEPADEPPSEVAASEGEDATEEEEAAIDVDKAADVAECCVVGDETPPLELVKIVPPGGLHNPYDWKKLKEESPEDYLVKQFRLPGCNECHGGGGGGGFCPALSQGVWFWGNTDDVLFRLIALGSKGLEDQGFVRIQWGTVKAPMPEMGHVIKTSDHLWKIVSFIRSINPEGTNPPEKVIPGRMKDNPAE